MRKILSMLLLGLLIVACGQADPSAGQATQASPPPSSPPTAQPTPTPSPPPFATPVPQPSPPPSTGGAPVPAQLAQVAQQRLAAYLKLDPGALAVTGATPQEWPDSSLGCPAPDSTYAQVITEGFLLTFTGGSPAREYAVHTTVGADQLVLCENGTPIDLNAEAAAEGGAEPSRTDPALLDEQGRQLLALARAALARDLGVAEADIQLISGEPIEWRDSSLGCPKPDQVYLQVITPGYRFELEAQGRRFFYHTDTGKRVVRCD